MHVLLVIEWKLQEVQIYVTKTNIPENISEFCVTIADVLIILGKIYIIGNNVQEIQHKIKGESLIIVSIQIPHN